MPNYNTSCKTKAENNHNFEIVVSIVFHSAIIIIFNIHVINPIFIYNFFFPFNSCDNIS